MSEFKNGQKVRIVAHGSRPEMNGIEGHVVRVLMLEDGVAWIRCTTALKPEWRSFLAPDARQDDTKVYSDEVEQIQ